ncbi:hypothetical protein ACL03H_17020 [Saccharopolyspora sp. MS10]|uniref:hypothetical protein n=1 Tax=Saccharopolyspora sp. MS10 TaxID=3385973 RepID=UPI00399EEF64
MSEVPAAARYKEIIAAASGAAERMREHEREKSARLAPEVAAAEQRIAAAAESRDAVRAKVDQTWKEAMAALWNERWMRVTPIPDPDRRVAAGRAETLIASVQEACDALQRSLGRSRWSPSLRRSRNPE